MPYDANGLRGSVVLFVPDIEDTITRNRVETFSLNGWKPVVVGFRRGRYTRNEPSGSLQVDLGRTQDARYWQRTVALIRGIRHLVRHREKIGEARLFYARNLDQLLLALVARALFHRQTPIVYEVLDVQPFLTGRGPLSVLARYVERSCLRTVGLLVLSSPGFFSGFYGPVQGFKGRWFLLENKLPRSATAFLRRPGRRVPSSRGERWRIGCFGLIRGLETLRLITRIAEALGDRVEFRFAGIFTSIEATAFAEAVRSHPNISYLGEYSNPTDLARLYGDVDFVWALDLENVATNSRWLLPCRFYEAGYFGVPCIAARDFEIGSVVEELGVGWAFGPPYLTAIVDFLRSLSIEDYAARQQHLSSLDEAHFVSGRDADRLSHLLGEMVG